MGETTKQTRRFPSKRGVAIVHEPTAMNRSVPRDESGKLELQLRKETLDTIRLQLELPHHLLDMTQLDGRILPLPMLSEGKEGNDLPA